MHRHPSFQLGYPLQSVAEDDDRAAFWSTPTKESGSRGGANTRRVRANSWVFFFQERPPPTPSPLQPQLKTR